MNQIFFALFLAIVGGDALAQSSLPPCPTDASIVRTNCVGTAATTTGGSYSGGFKDDQFSGEGTFTFVDGTKYIGEFRANEFYGKGSPISVDNYVLVEGVRLDQFTVITSKGRWYWASHSGLGNLFFVLSDSVQQVGALRRAWVIMANPKPDNGVLSSRALDIFDCTNERFQRMTTFNHKGPFASGEVISFDGTKNWMYLPPDVATRR